MNEELSASSKEQMISLVLSTAKDLEEEDVLFFVDKEKIDLTAIAILAMLRESPSGLLKNEIIKSLDKKQQTNAGYLLKQLEEKMFTKTTDDNKVKLTYPDGFKKANAALNIIYLEAVENPNKYRLKLRKNLLQASLIIIKYRLKPD